MKDGASGARSNAQEAFDLASEANNKSHKLIKNLEEVNDKIWEILKTEQPTPAEVRDLAQEVLRQYITLTPDEIKDLAAKIADIVNSLTDPEKILHETSADLQLAIELKDRANYTKNIAQEKEALVGKVIGLLHDSQATQELAQEAITQAEHDIKLSQNDIDEISEITKQAKTKVDDTTNSVNDLGKWFDNLTMARLESELSLSLKILMYRKK